MTALFSVGCVVGFLSDLAERAGVLGLVGLRSSSSQSAWRSFQLLWDYDVRCSEKKDLGAAD